MSRRSRPIDVAIVGLACRFPGAEDLSAYWQRTHPTDSGVQSRSAGDEGWGPNVLNLDMAGALPGRLARDLASVALLDAGLGRRGMRKKGLLFLKACDPVTVHLDTPEPMWSPQERVSRDAGLAGPSTLRTDETLLPDPIVILETPRTAPLQSLEFACLTLRRRGADLAIIAGISAAGFLRDGDRPISPGVAGPPIGDDHDEGGPIPGWGRGGAAIVLERLRDAERRSARIYAVIRGIDARPRPRTPRHDDPAPRLAVGPPGGTLHEDTGPGVEACTLPDRSAAGGVVRLVRSALCLHHAVLPVTDRAEGDVQHLGESDGPSNRALCRPWIHREPTARRIRVRSNRGGASNGSPEAILEEHAASSSGITPGAMLTWSHEPILIGAEDRPDLLGKARRLRDLLQARRELQLKDVAFTLASDSSSHPCRLGLVAETIDDLIARLDSVSARISEEGRSSLRDGRGAYYWSEPLRSRGKLAFLFPGEGSQYPGMMQELCLHFPEVRSYFDTSDRLALESGAIEPPSRLLFAPGEGDGSLWEQGTAVNVVLSSQWAIAQLLQRVGVRPDGVVGHSSGEFLAMGAAGSIAVDRRLEVLFNDLAAVFARLESSGDIPSARLMVAATHRDRAEAFLPPDRSAGPFLAIDNCPHQVVLAGSPERIDPVIARMRDAGIVCQELPFGRAYHTPEFSRVLEPLRNFFRSLEIREPGISLYSCCTAARVADDPDELRRVAIEQWTKPVEFRRTIERMYEDGFRVFVDVGSRGNLAGFVEDTLRGRQAFALAVQSPSRSGLAQLSHAVAGLFAQGFDIEPTLLFGRRRPKLVRLEQEPESRRSAGGRGWRTSPSGCSAAMTGAAHVLSPRSSARDEGPTFGSVPRVLSCQPVVAPMLARHDSGLTHQRDNPSGRLPEGQDSRSSMAGHAEPRMQTEGGLCRRTSPPNPQPLPERGSKSSPVDARPAWIGGVLRHVPWREIVTEVTLDADGDPIAEHHTFGGRRISELDLDARGLPVLPFTIMAEMLAEGASQLAPGQILVGLEEIRARRWIRYQDSPIKLELRAVAITARPGAFRVTLTNRGPGGDSGPMEATPDAEGVVLFSPGRSDPPAPRLTLREPVQQSRFTADSLYGEQWLFHGPALRGVTEVGAVSPGGIEGRLRVLPRRGLHRDPSSARPLTDPIVLDAFTHLLGCWGLDQLSRADVIFPLRLGALEIYGDDPQEGTEIECRIAVRSIEPMRVNAEAEILRPDGRVWLRIRDWDDWRFDWPARYRDVFRMPDRVLLGDPLPVEDEDCLSAVWIEPPADMTRPVWRDVLERIQLSPGEAPLPTAGESQASPRAEDLFGRIAAKEAARRLWIRQGRGSTYPADLSVEPGVSGRWTVIRKGDHVPELVVSMSNTGDVGLGLASLDPRMRLGVDVLEIGVDSRRPDLSRDLHHELESHGENRIAWSARLACATRAALKSAGMGAEADLAGVSIERFERDTGLVAVRLDGRATESHAAFTGRCLSVRTAANRRFAWAWTAWRED